MTTQVSFIYRTQYPFQVVEAAAEQIPQANCTPLGMTSLDRDVETAHHLGIASAVLKGLRKAGRDFARKLLNSKYFCMAATLR